MSGVARLVIMVLAVALALFACGKEEAKKVEVPGPLAAQEETARQVASLNARLDELAKKNEELDREFARLEKKTAEVDRLFDEFEKQSAELERREKALGKARSEQARKKAPPPKKAEKKKKKRKLEVVEPVPTGPKEAGKEGGVDGATPGEEGAGPGPVVPGDLALINIKFATAVDRQNRNPVEPSDSFKLADEKVYCWTVFAYKGTEDTTANIVWKRDGKEISTIQLRVGHSSHWRTWSYIRLTDKSVGEWEAQIQDLSGNVLGAGKFAVTE